MLFPRLSARRFDSSTPSSGEQPPLAKRFLLTPQLRRLRVESTVRVRGTLEKCPLPIARSASIPARFTPASGPTRDRGARRADLSDHIVCVRGHQHAADLFNLQRFGNIYTRIMNPTTAVFEERMAVARRRRGRAGGGSGQAAQLIALAGLLEAGDEIVAAKHALRRHLHAVRCQPAALRHQHHVRRPRRSRELPARDHAARRKVIYGETIGNPRMNVLDIAAVAAIAHDANMPLMIDNTFASPYLCRPIEHGADIVVHSATKFIGGHGTCIGGVIVDSGRFPWGEGAFPQLLEPSKGYHGIRFYETFGDFAYIMKARVEGLRDLGPALSPFNAFLFLQGVETLGLRMERHCGQRARGGRVSGRSTRGQLGQLPVAAVEPLSRPGAAIPAARVRRDPDVRHQGRTGRRPALHRSAAAVLAPGQRRRRQEPGDPPGLHHPPAAQRGGAARRRRDCTT